MDLQKTVNNEMKAIIDSGFVKEAIQKQLKDTITSIVNDSLRSYSDFGSELSKVLKESLLFDVKQLSFPEYATILKSYVTSELDNQLKGEAGKMMTETIKKYFEPLEKEEWRLSDIISKFKEEIRDDEDLHDCTIIVDSGSLDGYYEVYLGKDSGTSKYRCEYQMRIKKDEGIWALEIDESDMSKYKGKAIFGFDRLLFQLYSMRVKIELDELDYSQELYDY